MILDEIIAKTRADLEIKKQNLPFSWLENSFKSGSYVRRDVIKALSSSDDEPFRIIAEVKKASPSKGIIRADFNPLKIAKEYENSGANAISVLTEPHYFKGDLEYLALLRRYLKTPLLRKDFIVEKYQILEAAVFGADFVLLIAKALEAEILKELFLYARSLGLEVLFETHDEDDIKKALYAGANIIGINHRNLDDFSMDMGLCERLVPLLPKGKIVVAESGIYTHEQLKELGKIGVSAFLIGEHFTRKDDVGLALNQIKRGF
ncbi:indole-3-glycerol phosphate synthase TrpC [Campylobacter gastrosuis]|uniref:Indole-3-glycerol phosphate synthase n=1 Tax=Campylobacter gastrosuis TaxID=2974576 RepID=A0ABT7HQH9_9BACT|nr:indole-3-glycerol phosphate synthase TrpC [Campylobacter gastrosuis]MDL0089159.1 indole-3-glycerol phosphate synthase TrpC [Campylobacter gastrosuis]